ncbi:hypothetical protein CB1_000350019 [Camelus ferus]|nr:hypothetical protein CB1_000350019 [Camelus ferus]
MRAPHSHVRSSSDVSTTEFTGRKQGNSFDSIFPQQVRVIYWCDRYQPAGEPSAATDVERSPALRVGRPPNPRGSTFSSKTQPWGNSDTLGMPGKVQLPLRHDAATLLVGQQGPGAQTPTRAGQTAGVPPSSSSQTPPPGPGRLRQRAVWGCAACFTSAQR